MSDRLREIEQRLATGYYAVVSSVPTHHAPDVRWLIAHIEQLAEELEQAQRGHKILLNAMGEQQVELDHTKPVIEAARELSRRDLYGPMFRDVCALRQALREMDVVVPKGRNYGTS